MPGQVWESFKDSRNGKANTSLEKAQSLEAGMFSFMCFSKKSSPSPAPSLSIITNFSIGALQLFLSDSQGNAEKLQSGDIKRNMTMMMTQVNLIILSLFNTSNHQVSLHVPILSPLPPLPLITRGGNPSLPKAIRGQAWTLQHFCPPSRQGSKILGQSANPSQVQAGP